MQVVDIEENVWSHLYGLKGKIDVTANLHVRNCKLNKIDKVLLPIEIKTGRDNVSMEHRIQVSFCFSVIFSFLFYYNIK